MPGGQTVHARSAILPNHKGFRNRVRSVLSARCSPVTRLLATRSVDLGSEALS